MLATSSCKELNRILEMTQLTFARAILLQTCYGLISYTTGKSPTCYVLATGKLV